MDRWHSRVKVAGMKHIGVLFLVFMVFAASSNTYKIATMGLEPQNVLSLASYPELGQSESDKPELDRSEHDEPTQKLRLGLCAVPGFIETGQDFIFAQHNCERLQPMMSQSFDGFVPSPVKRPPKPTSFV